MNPSANFLSKAAGPKRRAALLFLVCFGASVWSGPRTDASGGGSHWAFQPLSSPAPPLPSDGERALHPIDAFITARQAELGLEPNPPLDSRRLVRRVYFDLIGLPPPPEEAESFDSSGEAYAGLLDRLLASAHYGERWGRHWLDVARYADSMGYRYDDNTPFAHAYRDFVIRAFNADLPFDTFIQWQLAGDELAPDDPAALAATGLMAVGPRERDEGTARNRLETRLNELDDVVSTVFSATLGLNMNCARCHDHKYDPVSQTEYYQVLKAFLTGQRRELPLRTRAQREEWAAWSQARDTLEERFSVWREEQLEPVRRWLEAERPSVAAAWRAKLAEEDFKGDQLSVLFEAADDEMKGALPEAWIEEWRSFARAREELAARQPPEPLRALAYVDTQAAPRPSHLFVRGDIDRRGEEVEFGVPRVLSRAAFHQPAPPSGARTTFQRAALAQWLTDPDAGAGHLLARVTVNRLWLHHFGEGLVRTPNDFGAQGDRPALPELLDWLSQELIRNEWRLKPMHRLIMTSAAYQRDIQQDEARLARDPENRYWWRRQPRRLEAEILRDSMLAVSGTLNPTMFGPGVVQPVPPELILSRLGQSYPASVEDGPERWRRSVYSFIKRTVPAPMMQLFDGPDNNASCGRRLETIVAPQALLLMNDAFVRRRSGDFADRLLAESGSDSAGQVERAFGLALGRPPSPEETRQSRQFLAAQAEGHGGNVRAALTDFCQVLFGINEFIHVD